MIDAEGTELQPGDIVEWLRAGSLNIPNDLHIVTEKQDGGEGIIRVKCICTDCLEDDERPLDIFYFQQTNVRLVERMPTPEYYKHTRSG